MATPDLTDPLRRGLSLDLWGDPVEEIALLQREIEAVDQERVRGAERRRLARLHHMLGRQQLRLGDDAAAARAFKQAYALAPRFRPNLRSAQALYELRGDHRLLAGLLAAEAKACGDPAQQSGLLRRQALLHWARLDNPDRAGEALDQARRLDPGNLTTLRLRELLCAATGDLEGVENQLRLQTRLLPPSPRVSALLTCRALLAAPRRQGKALALLRQALEMDPENEPAACFMEQLLDRQGDAPGLAPLLDELLAGAEAMAPDKQARLLSRAARISALTDGAGALTLAQRAMELRPDAEAAQELMELLLRRGDLRSAAAVGDRLLDLDLPDEEARRVASELAELHRIVLGDAAGAARCYRRILALTPGHPMALEGLELLLGDSAAGVDLAELRQAREAAVIAARGPAEELEGLLACARLAEQEGHPELALERHGQLLVERPGFLPSLLAQERLYARLGRWTELLQLFDEQLSSTGEQAQITQLQERMAWIWQFHLGQADAALECHQNILASDPAHLPSIRTAARLCAATGRYDELLAFNDQEAELTSSSSRRAELHCASARVARDRLQDPERAAEFYLQALVEEPGDVEALETLRDTYRRPGAWRDLARLLGQRLGHGGDAAELIPLLHELARLQRARLDEPEGAAATLGQVLELSPGDREAVEALAALHTDQGRPHEAAVTLEAGAAAVAHEPGPEAPRWLARAAVVRRDHLGDEATAQALFIRALELSPHFEPALLGLEQLGVEPPPPDSDATSGPTDETVMTRTVKVPLTSAAGARALLLDGAGGPAAGKGELALRALERSARIGGHREELELALRRRLRGSDDPMERACLHVELAELARDAEDQEGAERAFGEAMACYPGHPGALWGLARIYTEQGRWLELARIFQREAETMESLRCRQDALIRAGIVLEERVGARPRALVLYQKVLHADPTHQEAFQRLVDGLESDDRSAELASALRARINVTDEPAQAAALLCRLGRLYVEQLQEERKGMACLRRAAELAPDNQEALLALADRHFARQEWQEAEDLYTRTVSTVEAPRERSRICRRLGEIQLGMDMPLAALGSLQRVREEEEEPTRETLNLLLRAARAARDAGAQGDALEQLLSLVDDPEERLALLKEGARLLDEEVGDHDRAIALLEEALALSPVDIEAIEHLAAVYGSRGDKEAVDRHLAQAAARVRQGLRKDPLDGGTYRQLGRIYKWQRQFDAFFCSCVARSYLEEVEQREDLLEEAERSFLTLHQYRGAPTPLGKLQDHRVDGLLLPAGMNSPLRKLLQLGRGPLHRLIAMAPISLGLDVDSEVAEGHPLHTLTREIAGQLGGIDFELHITSSRDSLIAAEVLHRPALIISEDLARGLISAGERFRMGRALFLIREGALPLLDMTIKRTLSQLAALGRVADPVCELPFQVEEEALAREALRLNQVTEDEERQRLGEGLPPLARALEGVDLEEYKDALMRGANRAGLAVAGDPLRALHEAGDSEEHPDGVGPLTADLLAYLVDARFIALRRDLGLSPGAWM